jgi:hypothetical protein
MFLGSPAETAPALSPEQIADLHEELAAVIGKVIGAQQPAAVGVTAQSRVHVLQV